MEANNTQAKDIAEERWEVIHYPDDYPEVVDSESRATVTPSVGTAARADLIAQAPRMLAALEATVAVVADLALRLQEHGAPEPSTADALRIEAIGNEALAVAAAARGKA